ncbi:hypothetical protein Tco_0444833 [Tanacetum coccineum]
MSSASSAITYTSVYTDSEPGRTPLVPHDEDEREPMFIQAHDPDYVPEPIYPEYIPLEDEHVFPVEEQPLPPVDSPTAESPGYVVESDPEEDPEECEDDETEDGPVDYPMDEGDDGDDDDGDSSGNDADDEDEDEEDEEEEEEEHPDSGSHLTISRITVWLQASISLSQVAEVERLLAMTTPSPSPPISLSPPSAGERLTRNDIPKSEQPPHKRLCLSTLGSRYEIGESSTARPTGDPTEAVPEIAPMTVGEVNTRVTELAELHERDTQDLYALLEDAQDSRTRISQRVAMDSQRVDLLMRDRMTL